MARIFYNQQRREGEMFHEIKLLKMYLHYDAPGQGVRGEGQGKRLELIRC